MSGETEAIEAGVRHGIGESYTGGPVRLPVATWRVLLTQQGPSLGLWRAAEIAVLRTVRLDRPLLDLGCGDGLVTRLAVGQVELGLDPDASALQRAERQGVYERLLAVPAEAAPVPDGSIGTIVSNSVLEHVPAVDAVLAAAARLLRPGGRLVMTTPTDAFSTQLALPFAAYAGWRNRTLQHLNLWTVAEWRQHLARVGLEIEMVRPYLRPRLVRLWDALELLQQVTVGRRRLFGLVWRRLPRPVIDGLAHQAARLDLSAPAPGGGRMIIARRC